MADHTLRLVGTTIASQFKIENKLGAGGMGAVYLADQLGMDRHVVVKVMHPELTAGSPTAVERFKREARAVAQLNHPNIVQIYVFGQTESGQMYIAMEYIEGGTLADELEAGPLAQVRALLIFDQVCSALVEAHGAGMVHRDLKPDNIMLTDRHGNADYVKVLDFGIAKLAEKDANLTQAGEVFGTPRYMAPEQATAGHIDARTDIYSLGLILYEMLTALHPFPTATTALDYMYQHTTGEIVPLRDVAIEGRRFSPRLDSIIERCVQKDPAARYQSVRDLQRDVRLALRDFPEAQRGFPTGDSDPKAVAQAQRTAQAASAKAPAPVAGTGAPVVHVERSVRRARSNSGGAPAWLWATVGVLIAVGIGVGVALGVGGSKTIGPTQETVVADLDPHVATGEPATREADEADVVDKRVAEVTAENTAPPETQAPPPETAPPTTEVAEGMPIDGFPIPARAQNTMSSPQAEMFESDLAASEIMAFYRAKLGTKYGDPTDIPNGLMFNGTKSPFSTISLSPAGGGRLTIMLARNTLYEGTTANSGSVEGQLFFGLSAPSDASIVMKSPKAAILRSRKSFAEVCAFFGDQVSNLPEIISQKDLDGSTPYCNFVGAQNPDALWSAISLVADPMSKGAVMISIVPKQ